MGIEGHAYLCVQIPGGVVYGGCGSLHRYTDDARAAKEGYRTSGGNLPGDRVGLISRTRLTFVMSTSDGSNLFDQT